MAILAPTSTRLVKCVVVLCKFEVSKSEIRSSLYKMQEMMHQSSTIGSKIISFNSVKPDLILNLTNNALSRFPDIAKLKSKC